MTGALWIVCEGAAHLIYASSGPLEKARLEALSTAVTEFNLEGALPISQLHYCE
jgi:hypothetical protein